MTITLTLWQRLNLEGIIRRQKMGDGEDFLTLLDLWKKITVPDSERKNYAGSHCSACGVGRIWDKDAIALVASLEVDLDKAEARKAQTLIASYKELTVDDGEWFLPLKADLAAALGETSPAAATARPGRANRPAN